MSNIYRGPSKDAAYQALIHLPRRFQRRRCFRNQPIRNKNDLWWPCLLTDQDEMSNLYREPSIDAFYQVSVHLAYRFQRRRFLKIGQSEKKNCLWRPCLLMDRHKISNRYRRHYFNATYQISVHLGKQLQRRRFFRNQPIKNKNGLWQSCLLMDRDEISNLHKWTSVHASCQVSVHLAKRLQRRWFLKIGQSETRIACGGHVC
jgi:hypothetical protein